MAMMNKNIFFAISIVMAITIVLAIATTTTTNRGEEENQVTTKVFDFSKPTQGEEQTLEQEEEVGVEGHENEPTSPDIKRKNRFLMEGISFTTATRNPNAADHCNKDYDVCYAYGSSGTTCCNNKCIDVKTNSKNCGTCGNHCKFTQACCNGKCVYLSYDKRNCGACGNKCPGGLCLYGLCDYA